MHALSAEDIISLLHLEPHMEGGYYYRYYRSKEVIPAQALPSRFSGDRNYATAIYYLLQQGEKGHFHRVNSDEIWHFYIGDPLTLVQLSPEGQLDEIMLGHELHKGHTPCHVVPAGYWFGALPAKESSFCFVGCTIAPGFDLADFTMADRQALLTHFPQHRHWIEQLTD